MQQLNISIYQGLAQEVRAIMDSLYSLLFIPCDTLNEIDNLVLFSRF